MEKKTNEKKVLVLSFLGVLTFIAVVVGATYAYFTAQGGGTGNINVNATTNTTDNLSFQVGNAISLTANQEDFASGMGNKSGETYARAILTANNATNNATRNYYVYLDIQSNNFEYTTEDEQGELLLKVTGPDGSEVTTLLGLTRKTNGSGDNQVTGFDITETTGLITIADNYEITSTGTETQEWKIEVIFVNLDSDQNANAGKAFNANLIIQEESMVTTLGNAAEYITSLYTTDGENGLYLHDGVGTYGSQEAGDNSYRYTGANPNNYVCFGSDEETCPADNLYRIIGVFGNQVKLIKHDYAGSNLLGTNGAYQGAATSLGNYYKGSQSTLDSYYWNSAYNNTWSASTLNIVNLNTNYLNNIGNKWSNLIATTEWIVGGNTTSNIYNVTVRQAYQNEIVNPAESTTYSAKIGLMYVSDYYYGASPTYWTYHGYTTSSKPNEEGQYGEEYDYRAAINDNWMFMGYYEWTISRRSDDTDNAFRVGSTGYVGDIGVDNGSYGVRPSFYLESSVEFSSGDGTIDSPYRIQAGA